MIKCFSSPLTNRISYSLYVANLENLSKAFDKLNVVREQSLTISREIVRECSKSIRNVHRNDISDAEKHIKSAQEKLNNLTKDTEYLDLST